MSFLNLLFTTERGRHTLAYYALITCLGLSMGLSGPTLPALADQTGTAVGQLGYLFLAGSMGGTLGTFLGGRLFDRLNGHRVLGLAQMLAAALLFLYPFMPWLWLLLLAAACKGIADGIINTGSNTLIMWTHSQQAGPFMNALHFAFGFGAFVSPFIVAQVVEIDSGYRWAYWALASVAFLAGMWVFTLAGGPAPVRSTDAGSHALPGRVPYAFVIIAALFLFFYVGAELTFGGWIYTYAVSLNLAGAAEAAYLTSAFWLAFTVGRLLSIPLATRFAPVGVISASLAGCLAVLGLFLVLPGSSLVLWAGAIGLGFCMAPIYATGFNLAGQSLQLTARVSGFILLGDSFGAMLLPWLTGQVLGASGPAAMVYLVFGSLVLNTLAFAAMLRMRPRPSAGFSPAPPPYRPAVEKADTT